jgi:hypothetical protein
MQHEEAVRTGLTEKYLIGELTPEVRDQFEEHLFDCRECATDLRAAAAFLEHSKTVLSEPDTPRVPRPAQPERKRGWLSWLTPAFAAPALAALLVVVGYQNFVAIPHMKSSQNSPELLPALYLVSATRGSAPSVAVAQGEAFLVSVDVPADRRFSSYTAELLDPAGSTEWSLAIPADATKDSIPLRIPPVRRGPGAYTLVVHGTAADGSTAEVGRYPFEVRAR